MEARAQTPTLQESSIVERVARIVSSVRGTKPDYTQLAAELEPAIPFDVFGVVLLRHDRQAVRVTVCQREAGNWVAQHHLHPLSGSMVERELRAPVTIIENYPNGLDGLPAKCGDALSACPQLRAILIAPLVVGEQVLGTLELGSTIHDTYADETLQRLIAAVVRVLAAAIESAQMGGSAEIQDRQRQALKGVSSALASEEMDLSAILHQIVDGIANALRLASAIITLDQHEHSLRLEAQTGLDPQKLQKLIRVKAALTDRTIIGYTLRHRQSRVSNDISIDERFPDSSVFTTELGIRSIFSYPLVTGTTVYGALLLCSSEAGGFTPLKSDILALFASQATIAIHNRMLIESAHQRSRFQKAIEQLEHAYGQNMDEQELLKRVRQEAQQTFGVDFSSLLHFISDHLLTRSERDFQVMLQATFQEESDVDAGLLAFNMKPHGDTSLPEAFEDDELVNRKGKVALQGIALLTQTAEAALARAEVLGELDRLMTRLKQAPDHMKDAWFVIDLNGLCFYMNPAAKVFCGLHNDIVPESTIEDIFGELMPRIRNAEEVQAYLQDFSQGNVFREDLRCVLAAEPVQRRTSPHDGDSTTRQDGEYTSRASLITDGAFTDQYYQMSRYPLCNQQGILKANVLQVQDVTAQVRDEKNKSALLSSVSHELRTPLTTIKAGVTGLLQTELEWDEQTRQEILEEVSAEADHLDALVNGLVELSRIEMGALVLHKEWCDVIEMVHGTLSRLERTLAGRTLETDIQENVPVIYADYVQLERVFTHLIEYAVNHSPAEAEVCVCIDIVYGTTDKTVQRFLRVKITGQGYGTSANERERIFKAFYGLNLRGSGLGLAISRGIIEAHEGQIGVEATPDGNSSYVVFTLPLYTYNGAPSLTPKVSDDGSSATDQGPAGNSGSLPASFYASSGNSQFIASMEEQ
ncbi:MAG: GAF domain-containing protein [Ktedonobacteraceae bacterium]